MLEGTHYSAMNFYLKDLTEITLKGYTEERTMSIILQNFIPGIGSVVQIVTILKEGCFLCTHISLPNTESLLCKMGTFVSLLIYF